MYCYVLNVAVEKQLFQLLALYCNLKADSLCKEKAKHLILRNLIKTNNMHSRAAKDEVERMILMENVLVSFSFDRNSFFLRTPF